MFAVEVPGVFAPVDGNCCCFAWFEVDCEAVVGKVCVDGGGVTCDGVAERSVVVVVDKEGDVINPDQHSGWGS